MHVESSPHSSTTAVSERLVKSWRIVLDFRMPLEAHPLILRTHESQYRPIHNANKHSRPNMATQRPASKATAAAARLPQEERPRRWQHDIEAVVCAACHAPFTTLRRKHHCRSCGRIFCGHCSDTRLLVPGDAMARPRRGQPAAALTPLDLDPRTPQRVCPPCAEGLLACQKELRRTVSRASQVCVCAAIYVCGRVWEFGGFVCSS